MAGDLDDFRKPLDAGPAMDRWVGATRRRLHEALSAGRAVGGANLPPNRPSTIKIKKHDRVGQGKRPEMLGQILTEGLERGANTSDGASREVPAGPDFRKLALFIRGNANNVVVKKAANGKTHARKIGSVPPRDFVGIAEADVDAAGEDVMADVLKTWGFS